MCIQASVLLGQTYCPYLIIIAVANRYGYISTHEQLEIHFSKIQTPIFLPGHHFSKVAWSQDPISKISSINPRGIAKNVSSWSYIERNLRNLWTSVSTGWTIDFLIQQFAIQMQPKYSEPDHPWKLHCNSLVCCVLSAWCKMYSILYYDSLGLISEGRLRSCFVLCIQSVAIWLWVLTCLE